VTLSLIVCLLVRVGGKRMDWHSVFTVLGIVLFVVLMMRGCGGMMSGGCGMGGCGMGSRRMRHDSKEQDTKGSEQSSETKR